MLVALEHMQVSWVTVYRTHVHRFKTNVISFPQDSVVFFLYRMGVLQQYRVGDRVNSVHGPGDVLLRDVVLAADCSEEMLRKHVVNDLGHVVFAATVVDVLDDGALCVHYDDYVERGVEPAGAVRPRIQMPWHPRF